MFYLCPSCVVFVHRDLRNNGEVGDREGLKKRQTFDVIYIVFFQKISKSLPAVKHIIYIDNKKKLTSGSFSPNVKLLSMIEVEENGRKAGNRAGGWQCSIT